MSSILEVADLRVTSGVDWSAAARGGRAELLGGPRAHGGGDRRSRGRQDGQLAGDQGVPPADGQVTGSIRLRVGKWSGWPRKGTPIASRVRRGDGVPGPTTRSLNPTMRVGTQITEAVTAHADLNKAAARERALELLGLVRLPAAEQRFGEYPHQLSGGMRQRVMIAIALAAQPRLLIADEATTALDVTTQAQIMELLLELQEKLGMALVMISHDLGLAASFADEVIVMYAGRAVEQAPTRELFRNVRMPYTKALLEAIPRLERPPHTMLPVVPGRPPDLTSLGAGCPFEPRCPNAQEDCRVTAPPLTEHEPSHRYACWHPVRDTAEVAAS